MTTKNRQTTRRYNLFYRRTYTLPTTTIEVKPNGGIQTVPDDYRERWLKQGWELVKTEIIDGRVEEEWKKITKRS